MKYRQGISWHEYYLGCVTHSPHDIQLVPDAKGIRQSSRHHLYLQANAAIIEQKPRPFVDMGIWVPCPFSDWCAQLVIAANRICRDCTDLNRATVHDAYPIVAMQVILSRFSGKGMFSIWDVDRGCNQIMNTLRAALRAAFECQGVHWMSWRTLFGCTNAPATFARNMDPTITETKAELKGKTSDQELDNYYADYILSGPSEDWLGRLKATAIFLNIAIKHRWKFKVSKIRIAYSEVKILGVIVSSNEKRTDSDTSTLLSMDAPQNLSDVKSFVSLVH
jgi:hypothetical protein